MALTLNQVISRLQSLAESHHQINDFYFGDPHEFLENGEIDYAACFVQQLSGSIDRDLRIQTFRFRVYFFDLVGVSEDTEGNETEVLSDMHSVAADFLAMLNYTGYQDDWTIENRSTIEPLTEQLADMVAGVSVDIGIEVEYAADRCQVPSDDVTFEDPFDMARTKIVTYTGGSSETSTVTVTGLSGKTVLAVYRAGRYLRAITTVPTDADKIKVTGTDLGSYKGILSSDGTAVLQVGDALLNGEVLDFIVWSS